MSTNTIQPDISQYDTLRRGPSAYHGRGQYYGALNKFFSDGKQVRVYASFKRIGDKQGWGRPELVSGLELDRERFLYEWKLSQVGARLSELVSDGCEIVSYKKANAPGDMVTYILVSFPTNRELERNRAARVLRKSPKQTAFPRSARPFQHSNPRIEVAPISSFSAGKREETERERPTSDTRHRRALEFERTFGKPKPSTGTTDSTTIELPLFSVVRE